MANKNIFTSYQSPDVVPNNAGGIAYALPEKAALAQYVMTGTFNDTFYVNAQTDVARIVELAFSVDTQYLAKLAILAREKGYMKDAPAMLLAVLSVRDAELFAAVFSRVIDNSKMLRTLVQIMRSGVTGRRSLGSGPKRLIAAWINNAKDTQLLNAVGQSPSMADIIKLARPKPEDKSREALYGYFLNKVSVSDVRLPDCIQQYEKFKLGHCSDVPQVDFRLLTHLPLSAENWKDIARHAPWQMTRMNLNTFARHGVFDDQELTQLIASRLCDSQLIRRAKVFPYHLLAAYLNIGHEIPNVVAEALIAAAEHATDNVPTLQGQVYVFPDVSGSMGMSVTGYRRGAGSKVRCVDVAGLIAATLLRKNPDAQVIPFEGHVHEVRLSARDSILTNARRLASIGGGATNCSAPLALLNRRKASADMLIYVSDCESWLDPARYGATATQAEWNTFKRRNSTAKLACIDIVPNQSVQARSGKDVLNIGGFSDAVFDVLKMFAEDKVSGDAWVGEVAQVHL